MVRILAGHAFQAEADRRLRDIEIDHLRRTARRHGRVRDASQAAGRGQSAEHLVEQAREPLRVDRADDGDLEIVPARDRRRVEAEQIRALDLRQALEGAAHRQAVRVALERGFAPGPADEAVRILALALQTGRDLGAHALDGIRIETGLAQRQPQQIEGRVGVAGERAETARHAVTLRRERQFDGPVVERPVEGVGVEVARPLVEQAAQHRRRAGLAGRVLRGAAFEDEVAGNQRYGVVLDQPGFDAGRGADLLDGGGAGPQPR